MAATKYLDYDGLLYFWGKLKAYFAKKATTLSGYGITDAKINNGTVTLGSNTITPLTSASSLNAAKLTGTASVNTTGKATTAGTADKVANKLTLKVKTGTTEGTDLYTFDGSGAKTLDIKQGSNITLTAASGQLTIAGVGDTKNTAGSTDSSSKLFLIGATSQAANPQTYSHDTAYVGTDGCLYSDGSKVLTTASTVAWSSISGKPSTYAPSSHNQASNTINAMTGYSKPSSTSAIAATDSLNAAIGKLEKEDEYLAGEIQLVSGVADNCYAATTAHQLLIVDLQDDKADKATTLSGYGITDAYTKTEVDSKLTSAMHYKGSVATVADLPSSGNQTGDFYNVTATGENYAWTGSDWDATGSIVDLAAITNGEIDTVVAS